jgi:hypothetical protein
VAAVATSDGHDRDDELNRTRCWLDDDNGDDDDDESINPSADRGLDGVCR